MSTIEFVKVREEQDAAGETKDATEHTSAQEGGDATEFVNVRDAAKRLGVHENTVRNLEKHGQLKAVRLPGSGFRRFRKQDIERMRKEMWSQFAPDTPMPAKRSKPSKRSPLTDEDYGA
jgi:excisionase family DNA binding protein